MIKVLFAEPNKKFLHLYEQKMCKYFDLIPVHDGLTALRQIKLAKPQLVLSEYRLPKISGLALLRHLRSLPEHFSTPFIFFSDAGGLEHALNYGANDWVSRSQTSPELLIERVYYHLKINNNLIKAQTNQYV